MYSPSMVSKVLGYGWEPHEAEEYVGDLTWRRLREYLEYSCDLASDVASLSATTLVSRYVTLLSCYVSRGSPTYGEDPDYRIPATVPIIQVEGKRSMMALFCCDGYCYLAWKDGV